MSKILDKKIELLILESIKENKFEYKYQPIYDIKLKRFTRVEQLIRVIDNQGKYINTELAIEVAEKTDLIYELEMYSFKKCCEFVSYIENTKVSLDKICLNISAYLFEKKEFIKQIKKILSQTKTEPNKICIEITESKNIKDNDAAQKNIEELVQLGIELALDDFGVGYANISRLINVKFNSIKLDKSLLKEIETSSRAKSILKEIICLVKKFSDDIVIEGVESKEHFEILKKLSCSYLQGFYFSKPLSQEKLVRFLEKVKVADMI